MNIKLWQMIDAIFERNFLNAVLLLKMLNKKGFFRFTYHLQTFFIFTLCMNVNNNIAPASCVCVRVCGFGMLH